MAEYGIARSKRTCIEIQDNGLQGIRVIVNGHEIDAWIECYGVSVNKGIPGYVELTIRCDEVKFVKGKDEALLLKP